MINNYLKKEEQQNKQNPKPSLALGRLGLWKRTLASAYFYS